MQCEDMQSYCCCFSEVMQLANCAAVPMVHTQKLGLYHKGSMAQNRTENRRSGTLFLIRGD